MAPYHFSFPKLHPAHYAPTLFSPSTVCSFSSLKPQKRISSQNVPARDRTIDFGKHKGRKLGSLPSNYLLWVSRNLRAREFEHWALLADEVLADDVYKDRLEWEAAQRVLTGDTGAGSKPENSAAELLEISERFGWDYEDRDAWARVDFAQLGTSSGGRIPRKSKGAILGSEWGKEKKVGTLTTGEEEEEEEVDRREVRRSRRRKQMETAKSEVAVKEKRNEGSGALKNEEAGNARKVFDPFPGRGALLAKINRMRGGE
ncbi:hypothetical protein J5N97_024432 [Dioscorea zingiberensis]|uniref:Uncharacterized protein n=1 Tax=Dioscorea zingiberensis TaxID=325984 RepID=A0A9D5H8Y3_9LILI|nr:hypothetical protein J5N97_024432 [Dioscorea zingiberensis]